MNENILNNVNLALKDINSLFKTSKNFKTISEDIKNVLSKYFNNVDEVYDKIVFKGFNEKFNYRYYKISFSSYLEDLQKSTRVDKNYF